MRELLVALALIAMAGCSLPGPSEPIVAGVRTVPAASVADQTGKQVNLWQSIELDFAGPLTSEADAVNPFTDKRLDVTFRAPRGQVTKVRGFYAADGQAAETSAESGGIWRVRFTPEQPGEWSYSAELRSGVDIALSNNPAGGVPISLQGSQGTFLVTAPASQSGGAYQHGVVRSAGHGFEHSDGTRWLKGGANSPENLLAYAGFDGTYRVAASNREGESSVGAALHTFTPHLRDWRPDDPSWKGAKGKGLVGAVNYLADQGMNAAYFLTLNVGGDGRDVWPWRDPDDPTRFDVSKLAQWNIIFEHMQSRGIALHIVLQETENELFLDAGETDRLRQLYFHEMIARFGHHPLLFWNLGEENGPVHWRPEGQTDAQRKAMIDFFAEHDPYRHPVLLHTHAEAADKDAILTPLLGYPGLSGLSFQVADRTTVNAEIRKWHDLSQKAERPWVITMDEIGTWQVGARADEDDPTHDDLRRHALWGAFLAGSAGVEWYFGAHQKGNDLTTQNWRSRANLWRQTRIALEFFRNELPLAGMEPCAGDAYCLAKHGEVYAIYMSEDTPALKPGDIAPGDYCLSQFNPQNGIMSPQLIPLTITADALPPELSSGGLQRDVVMLLRAREGAQQ